MRNDYEFWEDYLKRIKKEILKLCDKKETLQIDLHIHSNYSSDGKQTIKQIIDSTHLKGFDIIAITDHDTLNAYNELYSYVKNALTNPIIIPGIEFTMDNSDYGNQCHLLQLFVNPKDETIDNNVTKNFEASFNRSKIQFQRLKENLAMQEIFRKNNIKVSFGEYKKYLLENDLVPEYTTLCEYLMNKLQKKNITNFDIFKLFIKYNEKDVCENRRKLKQKRYEILKEKYKFQKGNFYNTRFLLSLLAVREVDDDWFDAPSSGSLSVNSYGQLKIDEINEKYNIFFAHPSENSLSVVEKIIASKKNIIGLEHNIRNKYQNVERFNDLLTKYNLYKIVGSDSHDDTLQFYQDLEFYKISSKDFKDIVEDII